MVAMEQSRCAWAGGDALMIEYHDQEWGVPLHDDRALFEFLVLEGAQAGLSWSTILKKRPAYRQAFDDFDPARVAVYDERKVAELLANPGIVRNRLKVAAAVNNARCFLEVQRACGSFDAYLWRFMDSTSRQPAPTALQPVPASTPASDALSRALKQRGFAFVGTTICYAFMQAVGIVNDHATTCFRWAELRALNAGADAGTP
jgi:DNA-3-methyladenine glycosylase I